MITYHSVYILLVKKKVRHSSMKLSGVWKTGWIILTKVHSEDRGSIVLRNVGNLPQYYTAS